MALLPRSAISERQNVGDAEKALRHAGKCPTADTASAQMTEAFVLEARIKAEPVPRLTTSASSSPDRYKPPRPMASSSRGMDGRDAEDIFVEIRRTEPVQDDFSTSTTKPPAESGTPRTRSEVRGSSA